MVEDNTGLPPKPSDDNVPNNLERRDFLQGFAAVPVLGLFGYALKTEMQYKNAQKPKLAVSSSSSKSSDLNIALLGAGEQGNVLMDTMLKIPNVRILAVCDIWTEYNLKKAVGKLKQYNSNVHGYEDYKDMLDQEKDLDAVIIATPDFWHAQHTVDCLRAGLNVYCEKEMSNNLEDARRMVLASRQTGKLLQIGHQRRSHPRYLHCYRNIIKDANMIGRIITINGQWNRYAKEPLGCSPKFIIPPERLKKYGYTSMEQFRNWRWYKHSGGGPIVDLGSHQIDIFNWFLDSAPKSVLASGGTFFHSPETHQWHDTVMMIFEYDTPGGNAIAYYQTQTHNSSQGYFENFMGDQGTLVLSESEAGYRGAVYHQPETPPWDEWVKKGYVTAPELRVPKLESALETLFDVRESISPDEHKIPIEFHDPYHQPHLENFFNAIRGTESLNCPADVGYETAVTVLKVNEAIASGQRLDYRPEEFKV